MFILLPLPYWKQRQACWPRYRSGCDLLSFYYLCRTGNNQNHIKSLSETVVICFHFTTFAVLETTVCAEHVQRVLLWFAFILLPLPYWKQRKQGVPVLWCVVICFHFTTFAVLETTACSGRGLRPPLWFAFILLPLPYWKQLCCNYSCPTPRCDLLSFYYLCRTGNNSDIIFICHDKLWFAFILLPLPYWKQLNQTTINNQPSCDLLSFYYLCRTGNNRPLFLRERSLVVICFHFTTFAVLETTNTWTNSQWTPLWFAFILLPLPYWKQPDGAYILAAGSCDLLSFYYLCRTGNNTALGERIIDVVVICFHFTTFAVLETTHRLAHPLVHLLWFAFILLPLPYWKQLHPNIYILRFRCDLLSFYYLCRTGNNLEQIHFPSRRLWFAFILLPLPYWKQPPHAIRVYYHRCDLLSFYYLCRTGNNPFIITIPR